MRRLLPSPSTANSVDSGASLSSTLNDGDRQKVSVGCFFLFLVGSEVPSLLGSWREKVVVDTAVAVVFLMSDS